MVQGICKVWGLGMFSIVALTTSNIFLTLRLFSFSNEDYPCTMSLGPQLRSWADSVLDQNNSAYTAFLRKASIVISEEANNKSGFKRHMDCSTNHKQVFDIDPSLGRSDDRRIFKIYDKVYVGPEHSKHSKSHVVSLATQSSADRLFWLTQVSRYWENAPISLAIFTPDVEYSIVKVYMQYLIACYPYVGRNIAVHFVYPRNRPPKIMNINLQNLLELCSQPIAVLKKLLLQRPKSMMKWRETMQYPQNLLRNIARKNCPTEWTFLTDVDIIPMPNMSRDLGKFLQSKEATSCQKCAFVVPTYEISEKASLPYTRNLLLNLVKIGEARPFHQKVFIYNQHATNFSRWEAREKEFPSEQEITISHSVTRFEFFYEPFYISKDSVPRHDERFIGYGFTRNTQVYEMYVSGYSFSVLSPVFTLHWGMQEKKGRPVWRERQNNLNRKLFEGFKREVYARYQRDPLGMMNSKKREKMYKRFPSS